MNTLARITGGLVLVVGLAQAQVASTPPEKLWNRRALGVGPAGDGEDLTHNQPEVILNEVLDTNVLRLITASLRMKETELKSVRLAPNDNGDAALFQLWQTVDKPFEKLGARLRKYVADRKDGHTKECLLMALTNRHVSISDPEVGIMAAKVPFLPVSWWKKQPEKILSDGTREIEFVHVDEGVAWRYVVHCSTDGKYEFPVSGPFGEKCDAIEYDPKYQQVIQQVMEQVKIEMRNERRDNQRRAGSRFNMLVEERLKAKGIEWRSPGTFRQHRYE